MIRPLPFRADDPRVARRNCQSSVLRRAVACLAVAYLGVAALLGCQSHIKVTTAILNNDYLKLAGLQDRVEEIRDDLERGWRALRGPNATLPTRDEFERLAASDSRESVGIILHNTFETAYHALPQEFRPDPDLATLSTTFESSGSEIERQLRFKLLYGSEQGANDEANRKSREVADRLIEAYATNLNAVSVYDKAAKIEATRQHEDIQVRPGLLEPYQAKRVLTLLAAGQRAFDAANNLTDQIEVTSTTVTDVYNRARAANLTDIEAELLYVYRYTAAPADGSAAASIDPDRISVKQNRENQIGGQRAQILYGRSIATDENASRIAGAPEKYWNEGFNYANADGVIGNTDIAIKVETDVGNERVGSATVYALTMDAEDATRATFATIKETVRFATLIAGVSGVPLPSATDANGKTKDGDAGTNPGTAGTFTFTIEAEREKRNATRLARSTRRATLRALDALAAQGATLATQPAAGDTAAQDAKSAATDAVKNAFKAAEAELKALAAKSEPPT